MSVLKKLLNEQIRDILREVPGDAQYVELTGSMMKAENRLKRDPSLVLIESVPICLTSMDVDDSTEWNSRATHSLHVQAVLRESVADAMFEIVAVDGYMLEEHDAAKIAAYIRTRHDIFKEITGRFAK